VFLDVAERFERLEARVAGLMDESKTVKQLEARMTGMETDVGRMTGALEHFLGQIRIDDSLRLVPDNRALGPPPTLAISSGQGTSRQMDVGVSTESGAGSGSDAHMPMNSDFGEDNPMMATPATATTPSDYQEEERMVLPLPPHVSAQFPPNPPEPIQTPGDVAMAPPPPPIHFIPATPQQSQESGRQEGLRQGEEVLEPGEIEQGPVIQAQARGRTPLILNVASSSRLAPPITRSRSRSKSPM
jgi:hypothetical protein